MLNDGAEQLESPGTSLSVPASLWDLSLGSFRTAGPLTSGAFSQSMPPKVARTKTEVGPPFIS